MEFQQFLNKEHKQKTSNSLSKYSPEQLIDLLNNQHQMALIVKSNIDAVTTELKQRLSKNIGIYNGE